MDNKVVQFSKKGITHPNKLMVWLHYFLDHSNKDTFLNKTSSAKAAGYRGKSENSFKSIGYQNFTKLHHVIAKWIDESGLSEVSLKVKLLDLLNAKETKFFAHGGVIISQVDIDALEVQRKALEMAMKVKGMFERDNAQSRTDLHLHIERADREAQQLAERICGEMKVKELRGNKYETLDVSSID